MAVGGLLDLDDMLAGAGPSGLGGIDLGGVGSSPQPAANQGGDMGFGFGNDGAAQEGEEQDDWANAFGGGDNAGSSTSLPLDFAKPELTEVLTSTQPGKNGNAGLKVRAHFFCNEQKQFSFGIELTNMTGQVLEQDFDVRFNKNAFAVHIANATNAL